MRVNRVSTQSVTSLSNGPSEWNLLWPTLLANDNTNIQPVQRRRSVRRKLSRRLERTRIGKRRRFVTCSENHVEIALRVNLLAFTPPQIEQPHERNQEDSITQNPTQQSTEKITLHPRKPKGQRT